MTGGDDAAAAEAAELQALRRRAEERRQELGDTLEALTARLAADTHLSTWARRGAQRATARLGHATVAAMRRPLPAPPRADAARAAIGQRPNRAVVLAVVIPGAIAATAAWWWWHSSRRPGRRRLSLMAR